MLFDGSAQQEVVSRKTSLVADDCVSLRPKGAAPISLICVTGLEKDMPFPAICCLIWFTGAALNRQTI